MLRGCARALRGDMIPLHEETLLPVDPPRDFGYYSRRTWLKYMDFEGGYVAAFGEDCVQLFELLHQFANNVREAIAQGEIQLPCGREITTDLDRFVVMPQIK